MTGKLSKALADQRIRQSLSPFGMMHGIQRHIAQARKLAVSGPRRQDATHVANGSYGFYRAAFSLTFWTKRSTSMTAR